MKSPNKYIAVHHRLPAHETHAQNGGDRQYRRSLPLG